MRKSFDELWEAMEARRQQVGAGEVPPAYRFEQTRQARRQRQGCPDEEALCGWVDGELRRHSLRRRLMVWQHVQVRRCRACQAEVAALAGASPPARPQLSWLASAVKYVIVPFHMAKTPLAWASSMLLIVVGLSLPSLRSFGSGSPALGNSTRSRKALCGAPIFSWCWWPEYAMMTPKASRGLTAPIGSLISSHPPSICRRGRRFPSS
jgi:hypothetical protein